MISVIILTENKNYSVMDVPTNGRLIIREKHVICAIVQNGVLVTPYGPNNPLFPFEVFIFSHDMSLDLIPDTAFRPEGRVLDFNSIELLQSQQTIHPSQSGSVGEYQPPVFFENGLEINSGLIFGGLNFANTDQATAHIWNNAYGNSKNSAARKYPNILCNSLTNIPNTEYQQLSIHYGGNEFNGIWNSPTTYIEDLNYGLEIINDNYHLDASQLEGLKLPNLVTYNYPTSTVTPQYPKLKYFEAPKLETLGLDVTDSRMFKTASIGATYKIPRYFETCNGGGLHASLQWLINAAKNPNIIFID